MVVVWWVGLAVGCGGRVWWVGVMAGVRVCLGDVGVDEWWWYSTANQQ